WWVLRSRMATDRAAPLAAASSAACWTRTCSWANPPLGNAWGGCGGVTASNISAADCGGAGDGGGVGGGRWGMTRTGGLTGRLYTFAWPSASEPAATSNVTAAVAVSSVSGRTRIRLLRRAVDPVLGRDRSRRLHRASRKGAGGAF